MIIHDTLSVLVVLKPHTIVAVVVHEVENTLSVLLVLKPLAFIFLSVREDIGAEALSFPFYVFAFVDIAILENGFPFTVRLSAFHLSGVYGTVFERIVSDFDFCGEGVFYFTKEASLALRHSAFLREKNQYECSI